MDETEVQIEIACWAQDHPEASTINWNNGNEPWVTFAGKRCTLHVGLGGLTWSIEVPSGYQTEIDPGDGKRRRLWEPLDYQDTVIVQSKSTPFHVSVVDHSNNILDMSSGLEKEFANKASLMVLVAGSGDEVEQQKVHDLLKDLQVKSDEVHTNVAGKESEIWLSMSHSSAVSEEEKKSRVVSNACFDALKGAETLGEVLDAIHGLAKLYDKHVKSSNAPVGAASTGCFDEDHNAEGFFAEDEDDDHIFGTEGAMKWSIIAAQVNYARDACANAAAVASHRRQVSSTNSETDSHTIFEENACGVPISSPSGSRDASDVPSTIVEFPYLATTSPPRDPPGPSNSFDSDDEYTFVLSRSSSGTPDICEDWRSQLKDADDASTLTAFQILSGDSDSDSSWEMPSFSDLEAQSKRELNRSGEPEDSIPRMRSGSRLRNKRTFQQMHSSQIAAQSKPELSWPSLSLAEEPIMKKASAECWTGLDDDPLWNGGAKVEESRHQSPKDLQWCDIAFNPVSFSVECTIRMHEFMDNPTAATALGFALENPLRVEIVPNKAQVDSLVWAGAVEVYVSQYSDWHNHISEEICGLLCLVPYIVQTYFHKHVPTVIRNLSEHGGTKPKGELFIGVLQTLVTRLISVNAGGSCCVCEKPGDRPSLLYMQGKSLWHCSDNLCQATYATWQQVSSVDLQDREREENSRLRLMQETLRDDFPYDDDQDLLKSALDVYGVNTDDMHYGQMIRALARIELWNKKDPDTPSSDALFET